ncbi:MAG: cytochrome c biogenesis protein ResB, partial [Deltaproteobacteria bacterium]|nr:cytochrome c biogenesis protein ResB [Deltaproteobacteria bacterium]
MTDKKTNPLWNLMKSVRLTLFLLALLAVASIIGTLVQEQDSAGIYRSLWFRLIILCLAVNLIACSIDRFPATLKRFRLTPRPDRTKVFEDADPRTILLHEADVDEVSSALKRSLMGKFNNLAVKESGGASFIYCEKGRFSLFSVHLVHLSVLFILAGALIGSIFGFNGYVNIPEGMATDSIVISDGDTYRYKKLGFIVRCEKFSIEYYKKENTEGAGEDKAGESRVVKEYRSDLSFFVNGQAAKSMVLRVNHPIKFMGITFYQSNYGVMPGDKVRIRA